MRPIGLNEAELVAVLRQMADLVEAGDSFDGSIEYTASTEAGPGPAYEVRASYRYGNRGHGQGFMRLVGEVGEL